MYNYFENVNLIIPASEKSGNLFLGNYKIAINPEFLVDNDISVIINCTIDSPYIYDILDYRTLNQYNLYTLETFKIPVYDSLLEYDINKMTEYLKIAIPFILKKCITEKKNILIHCYAGKQRSSCVVAAVLFTLIDNNIMQFKEIQMDNDKSKLMKNIIHYIIEKRPQAFSYALRVNFQKSLEDFFHLKNIY